MMCCIDHGCQLFLNIVQLTSYQRVTDELPTSYRQEYYYSYYIITSYHELPLKIKFKKLLLIFFYILMVTRGTSL